MADDKNKVTHSRQRGKRKRKDGSMELMRVKKVGLGVLQVNKQEKV